VLAAQAVAAQALVVLQMRQQELQTQVVVAAVLVMVVTAVQAVRVLLFFVCPPRPIQERHQVRLPLQRTDQIQY
jgi:hypothetical protein